MITCPDTSWSEDARDVALVLAGHGSSCDPRCGEPIMRAADALRHEGHFAEVIALFWKQRPHFRDVYELTAAHEIIVVPMMASGGYYTRTVLPREMRAGEPPAGRSIRVTKAIGELSAMAGLITAQAVEAATASGIRCTQAEVLIVGHGTMRDPKASGASALAHAAWMALRSMFFGVRVAFLEQPPFIAEALDAINGDHPIIVVPFLMADGEHALGDIRRRCGAAANTIRHDACGRTIIFTPAVGERVEIIGLVMTSAMAVLQPRPRTECATT